MSHQMELCSLSLLLLLVAVSHAHSHLTPQEAYWHSALPNTPMPNTIREFLSSDAKTSLDVMSGKWKPEGADVNMVTSHEKILQEDPGVAIYFHEKDLNPGAKMNLAFTRTSYRVTFLSRQDAASLPFSSSRLPDILNHFSIDPNSELAKSMMKTLQKCENPAVVGERRLCATSLESMVDFSTGSLGTNQLLATSTVVGAKEEEKPQPFIVAPSGIRMLPGDKVVSCHAEAYPYAMFYCHATPARAYVVELLGEDGTKVDAVATCHTDTKGWNPNELAFNVLKVKPGTEPVCHFHSQDHVVWTRSN